VADHRGIQRTEHPGKDVRVKEGLIYPVLTSTSVSDGLP
jgi:hypothetical protein